MRRLPVALGLWLAAAMMLWTGLRFEFFSVGPVVRIQDLPHYVGQTVYLRASADTPFVTVWFRGTGAVVQDLPERLTVHDATGSVDVDASSCEGRGLTVLRGPVRGGKLPNAEQATLLRGQVRVPRQDCEAVMEVLRPGETVWIYGTVAADLHITDPPKAWNIAHMFGQPRSVLIADMSEAALAHDRHVGGWFLLGFGTFAGLMGLLALSPQTVVSSAPP